MTFVVGVNAGAAASHDPSACLVDDRGQILAYVEEERLSRVRHAPKSFPKLSVYECLRVSGVSPSDVSSLAIGWDERQFYPRLGRSYALNSDTDWTRAAGLPDGIDVQYVDHHRAHATSALMASPYVEAGVVVVDGNGENESISLFRCRRGSTPVRLAHWPRVTSLGYMYEALNGWLGLGALNSGKSMGLATIGRGSDPLYTHFDLGSGIEGPLGDDPALDYDDIIPLWRKRFASLTGKDCSGIDPQKLDENADAINLAWSVQAEVERVLDYLVRRVRKETGLDEVCIAGGVALNCAANGRLAGDIFVPPFPHDAGVASGAAWSVHPDQSAPAAVSPYLGSEPGSCDDMRNFRRAPRQDLSRVVEALIGGSVGAVCEGRAEIGPRALGHRSIIASPGQVAMKGHLNSLKRREQWRPFGPVALTGEHRYWSNSDSELSRYMIGAAQMTELGLRDVGAAAHRDGTTRPQKLESTDGVIGLLLSSLDDEGVPPVLINTSLNAPGSPIANSASEAFEVSKDIGLDFVLYSGELYVNGTTEWGRRLG